MLAEEAGCVRSTGGSIPAFIGLTFGGAKGFSASTYGKPSAFFGFFQTVRNARFAVIPHGPALAKGSKFLKPLGRAGNNRRIESEQKSPQRCNNGR